MLFFGIFGINVVHCMYALLFYFTEFLDYFIQTAVLFLVLHKSRCLHRVKNLSPFDRSSQRTISVMTPRYQKKIIIHLHCLQWIRYEGWCRIIDANYYNSVQCCYSTSCSPLSLFLRLIYTRQQQENKIWPIWCGQMINPQKLNLQQYRIPGTSNHRWLRRKF